MEKNSKKVNETNPIDPLSFYAIGKAASEKYLSLFQTNSIKFLFLDYLMFTVLVKILIILNKV